jgi:chemotaxis signal transduction protein
MNFHGSIVAVMDLAAFLGLPGVRRPEKVVVLDPGVASLAFLVERVERIVPQGQAGVGAAPNEAFAVSRLDLHDGAATLLAAAAIAAAAAEAING